MPTYIYDHIHIRSQEPMKTARWYARMFNATIIQTPQIEGPPRIDLDINGLTLFIMHVPVDAPSPGAFTDVSLGLDHFGLKVDDIAEAFTDLRQKGVQFTLEPQEIRPGVTIAYVLAPENVRVELVQRD